ncbi:prepilin-type N-terminal cleavage/methylation domain-containing protein [Candidatus Sumerlaeota bacterium]|nr:prepilin-type N-terminal cleavage/methylation domain-containing protein [Candidatus Sumerlaeota bacterium]
MKKRLGFTLIELLIVVAIIAILAAIAVPNFLEAQTRSKVSRAKADMRSLATGIESYYVDNNSYPKGNPFNLSARASGDPPTMQYWILERLSTPIAYMTSALLPDPFLTKARSGSVNGATGAWGNEPNGTPISPTEQFENRHYKYFAGLSGSLSNVAALVSNPGDKANSFWLLYSSGPKNTRIQLAGGGLMGSSATTAGVSNNVYDPTNGTVSRGNIYRIGGASNTASNVFYTTIQQIQR